MAERLNAPIPGHASNEGPNPEGDDPESRAVRKVGADGLAMLRYRAANGSAGALDELKRHGVSQKAPDAASIQTSKAPAKTKPKAVETVAVKPTTAELVAKAKADARAKVATVKASSAYKGREATARKLLLDGKQSAAEIIKTLSSEPLDVQLAAVERHLKAKAVDQVWSKAYGTQRAPNATVAKPERVSKASEYDDIWQRAYSKPKLAPANPS